MNVDAAGGDWLAPLLALPSKRKTFYALSMLGANADITAENLDIWHSSETVVGMFGKQSASRMTMTSKHVIYCCTHREYFGSCRKVMQSQNLARLASQSVC